MQPLLPLTLVVAIARNRVIGSRGQLPWPTEKGRRPAWVAADMKHFREVTDGHAIIMGSKTFDSIGKALPKRTNIVVTRNPFRFCEARGWGVTPASAPHDGARGRDCLFSHSHNVYVAPSVERAIELARSVDPAPCVIGGADIYRQTLPLATKILITEVFEDFDGDVLFPEFDREHFVETRKTAMIETATIDQRSPPFSFIDIVELRRRSAADVHHQAMELVDQAKAMWRGRERTAAVGRDALLARALEKERLAAAMTEAQPTRAVLYRSAASIAAQLGRRADVEELVAHGLAGAPHAIAGELLAIRSQARGATENAGIKRVYVASRTRYGERWRATREQLKDDGIVVTSTWIDECEAGQSQDLSDLWRRCITEATEADFLILYAEDIVLKGALVEMGAALSHGVPVLLVASEDVDFSHVSAFAHPLVKRFYTMDAALSHVRAAAPKSRADS